MTKRDILRFLFKWSGTILGGTFVIVLLVTVLVYVLPPTYSVTAKILVERNLPPIRTDRPVMALDMLEVSNTEAEIVLSRPTMEAVVDQLKPHERGSSDTFVKRIVTDVSDWLIRQGLTNGITPREKWVIRLLRRVGVNPVTNSNVLVVSYEDEEPVWAARTVNAIVDAYQTHRLEVYRSAGAAEFYRGEMEALLAQIAEQRQALATFKQTHSLAAIERTQQALVQQLGAQTAQTSKLRLELTDLLERYNRDSPTVSSQQSKIDEIENEMAATRRELLAIEGYQQDIQELERQIGIQEGSLDVVRRMYSEQRLREAANTAATNIRVIAYATEPERPPFPRLFFIVLSLVGGLFLSLGIALLREYLDQGIDDPETVEAILGAPVLTSAGSYRV